MDRTKKAGEEGRCFNEGDFVIVGISADAACYREPEPLLDVAPFVPGAIINIDVSMESVAVRPKKLRTKWTPELKQDQDALDLWKYQEWLGVLTAFLDEERALVLKPSEGRLYEAKIKGLRLQEMKEEVVLREACPFQEEIDNQILKDLLEYANAIEDDRFHKEYYGYGLVLPIK